MTARLPILSVVVPCFNEEEVLAESAKRLDELFDRLIGAEQIHPDSRIFFVDDGSRDQTWSLIKELNDVKKRFGGIKLSRNRGHQRALLAGLLSVPGDLILSIDADLQDDLNAIDGMLKAHAEGADIVFGVRNDRSADTYFKRVTAQAYYGLIKKLGIEIVYNHADFRLMSRRVLEALRQYDESNLFLRALIVQLGFRSAIVEYERLERFGGTSKYTLRKMLSLAIQGITSFSTLPLRAITVLGFAVSSTSFLLGAWAFSSALVSGETVPGWASTVIPIYVICGVQMLCLGIIGEYVGRIYIETKRRPRFHIEEALDA
jgi:polyisoprenyl-phosphate glycosyltransferase